MEKALKLMEDSKRYAWGRIWKRLSEWKAVVHISTFEELTTNDVRGWRQAKSDIPSRAISTIFSIAGFCFKDQA